MVHAWLSERPQWAKIDTQEQIAHVALLNRPSKGDEAQIKFVLQQYAENMTHSIESLAYVEEDSMYFVFARLNKEMGR